MSVLTSQGLVTCPVTWANTGPAVEKRLLEYEAHGKPAGEQTSVNHLVTTMG